MVRSRSLASLICAATLVVALGALAFSGVLRAYAGDGLYAAQAAGKTRITIDGKAYTSAAHGKGESGTWDWDGQKKLTLTNFTGDSIMASGSLNVTVNGNVSLKYFGLEPILEAVEGHGVTATGEYYSGDISIAGKGKLVLSDGKTDDQLEALDVDYIKDPNPMSSGTSGFTSAFRWSNYSFNAATVTVKNCDFGISGGSVTISNGSTVVTKGSSLNGGTLTITDSSVSCNTTGNGIYGEKVIIQRSKVTSQTTPFLNQWNFFALTGDSISITDSSVSVLGGSSGLLARKTLKLSNSDITIKGQGLDVLDNSVKGKYGVMAVYVRDSIKLTDEGGASIVKRHIEHGLYGDNSYYSLQSKGYPEDTVVMKALRNVANGELSLAKARYTYDGEAKKPSVTVKIGSKTLKKDADFTVAYKNNKNAGKATVTVKGKGSYVGTLSKTFAIGKAANPMSVAAKTASVKYSKKKAQTVKASAAYKFSKKPVPGATYSRVAKGSSKWLPKVDPKTGAITVKAGAPRGKVQSVKVKVVAKGNGNYKPASKVVTVKVRVK